MWGWGQAKPGNKQDQSRDFSLLQATTIQHSISPNSNQQSQLIPSPYRTTSNQTQRSTMDALKNAVGMGGGENKPAEGQATEQSSSGGGFMDKLNSAAGGGKESEAKEDYLDKGMLLLLTIGLVLSDLTITPRHRHGPGEIHGWGPSGQ